MVKTLATGLPEDPGLSLSIHMIDSSHASINFSLRRSDTFFLVRLAPSLHTCRPTHGHINFKKKDKKGRKVDTQAVKTIRWISLTSEFDSRVLHGELTPKHCSLASTHMPWYMPIVHIHIPVHTCTHTQ